MTSKVKDFLPTQKIDLEKEDVYSKAPVEGGPKVTELSEDCLDNRLGHLGHAIHIPLKPRAKEISLPPFHASPANQEVINKQMDKWIQLGVIEPSKIPWAAPAFIVY